MFGWFSVNISVVTWLRTMAYPSEIPVNYVAGVEVIDAFRDIG